MEILNKLIFVLKSNDFDSITSIIVMLLLIFVLSTYEFVVYRLVSKHTMYNKQFHISIAVMPYFIGMIVASLQSNMILTLGTIGALAIIRFRTAIKDPVDMIYLLWSVYIGIACGCSLYKSCFLASVFVTIVLLFVNLISAKLISKPFILVINSSSKDDDAIENIVRNNSKRFKLKSRNFLKNEVDYIFQVEFKKGDKNNLIKELDSNKDISKYSLLAYDGDDLV